MKPAGQFVFALLAGLVRRPRKDHDGTSTTERMMVPRAFCLFTTLTLLGVGSLRAQSSDTTAVRVAALSWYLDSVLDQQSSHFAVVCVGYGAGRSGDARDFNAETMARLPKGAKPLRPRSACTDVGVSPTRTTEIATGRLAMRVTVATPTFLRLDQATIYLQARNGGGTSYECSISRQGGHWRTSACRVRSVS